MKEDFYKSKILSKERLKQLMVRSDHPALLRFVVMYVLIVLANIAVVYAWDKGWFYLLLSQFFYAVLVCSNFAALHETGHGTAFKSKRMNRLAAMLAGFTHIYPSSLFRELHFTHHRYTHVPGKDPEISLGGKPVPSVLLNPGTYLSWVTGIPILGFKIMMLVGGVLGMPEFLRKHLFIFVNPKARLKIFVESFFFLIPYVLLVYYAVTSVPALMAIVVGQVVGHCLLAYYLSMEHNGLPHEGTILEKTRSMRTSRLVKLVMWNMPYHAEHHAFPAVPFHRLPVLHKELETELKHKDESHLDFHMSVISGFLK